jgi:hypothetical protein
VSILKNQTFQIEEKNLFYPKVEFWSLGSASTTVSRPRVIDERLTFQKIQKIQRKNRGSQNLRLKIKIKSEINCFCFFSKFSNRS